MRPPGGIVNGHVTVLPPVGTERHRGARIGQQPSFEHDHLADVVDDPDLGRLEVLIDDVDIHRLEDLAGKLLDAHGDGRKRARQRKSLGTTSLPLQGNAPVDRCGQAACSPTRAISSAVTALVP
jgi:hypothetical protein